MPRIERKICEAIVNDVSAYLEAQAMDAEDRNELYAKDLRTTFENVFAMREDIIRWCSELTME